jgi:acetylornithine/N-succinyldiaminopimelate aminotransferase
MTASTAAKGTLSRTAELQRRWDASMMRNYGTPAIAIERGRGSTVWDVEGRSYLDLVGGIAVSSLGHAHPAIATAVSKQANQLVHTSNLAIHEVGLNLAERLLGLAGQPGRVFFSQDGATANEAAFKMARKHGWTKDPSGQSLEIIAAVDSFHGRTIGALSITGSEPKRTPFEPLAGPVNFVPYGNAGALAGAISQRTAAVFLEPIQGEAGIIVPPPDYLAQARQLCDEHAALLVVDEVQSGIGRTGAWFASIAQGVQPDVMTLAKGLGGGLPIGACLGFEAAGDLLQPGDHGSTFGGNPVIAAAALAVLDTIDSEGILAQARHKGHLIEDRFSGLGHSLLKSWRGKGLWWAFVLTEPLAVALQQRAAEAGYLVNAIRPDVVRIAPPLIITETEIEAFFKDLPNLLSLVKRGP